MKTIIISLFLIINISLNATDNFSKVVDAIIKQELKSIPKPPSQLNLVKDEFETVAFDKDKMVVLSAGKAYQYSNGYDKKGYRLFSFYIMKNILKGDTTVKSLYKDTKKQTYQTSLEEYGDSRTQEPTLQGNGRMKL